MICERCKREITEEEIKKNKFAQLVGKPDNPHIKYIWCLDCWYKDLANDSGNYFDNFHG